MKTSLETNKALLIFDDTCVLCNHSVQFIARQDFKDHFRFTGSNSAIASNFVSTVKNQSVVLIYQNKYYYRSLAVIQSLKILGGKWKTLGIILGVCPTFLADFVYSIIAKYRYQWFGKMTKCQVSNMEWKRKIIY